MPETDESSYRSPNRSHEQRFFYKYVSSRVAKAILANKTLRWSSPLLFNDPFDVTQELRLNFSESELQAAVTSELIAVIEQEGPYYTPSRPLNSQLALILKILRDKPEVRQLVVEELRRYSGTTTTGQIDAFAELKRVWRDYVHKMRVLCLSELNDSTPMWHHYAEAYRGAVLEFEAVDQLDSVFLIARRITYQDTPPDIANKEVWARCMLGRGTLTYKDLFTEYQYVKTSAWAYELEWRIVSVAPDGGLELFWDQGFDARELAGVYLGTQCSPDDEKEIISLLIANFEHVWVFKARIIGPGAKFTFERIR